MVNDTRPNAGPPGDGQGRKPWQEAELQRLVADIAARLRKSCAHLADDEFAALVLDIARRKLRFYAMDPGTGSVREARE